MEHARELLRLPFPTTRRLGLAGCAIVLAAEHHAAIGILISNGHYSTAHALARPLIETTMRALWLCHVAPHDVVTRLSEGRATHDLDEMAKALRRAKVDKLSTIGDAVLKQGNIFHSFAHAGFEQLVRRLRGYEEKEVLALLLLSDIFAAMAMALAAVIYDDDGLRQLAEISAPPLMLEAHFNWGSDRPEDGWRADLPPLPAWNDPD